MGYRAQRVGETGDHGVDVMLINPKSQKEIVQCKQWNKQVGEPVIRDLFGAMMHEGAVAVGFGHDEALAGLQEMGKGKAD